MSIRRSALTGFHSIALFILVALAAALLASCASTPPAEDGTASAEYQDPFASAAQVYDRMSAAVLLGDPQAAIKAYEAAKLENPDDPATLVLLARLYISAGDLPGAEDILNKVLESAEGQDRANALMSLSLIDRIRGNRDSEVSLLSQVLDQDPENPEANSAYGEILLERKNYEQAEQRFEKTLDTSPEDFVALQGLGNAYLLDGKSQDAISVLSKAIQVQPDSSYTYSDRARAYVEQGYNDLAIADMDKAVELNPDNGWHYLDRGKMEARDGSFEMARDDFTLAIRLMPDIFISYAYRAQMNSYLKDWDAAAEDYYSVLNARPDYYPAYAYLGAVEYIRGNYSKAEYFLDQALQNDDGNPQFVLFAAAAAYAVSKTEGDKYLQEHISKLERGGTLYNVGRYYVDNVDLQALNSLRNEDQNRTKAEGQFYLALQYIRKGMTDTA